MKRRSSDFYLRIITGIVTVIGILILVGTILFYSNMKRNAIDTIHKQAKDISVGLNGILKEEDFENINDIDDTRQKKYIEIHKILNTVQLSSDVKFLYTAKKNSEGKYIYLVDGLPIHDSDFRYPGDIFEKEFNEDLDTAYSGKSVVSSRIMSSEWGNIITAFYPIRSNDNPDDVYGILGITFSMDKTVERLNFLLTIGIVCFVVVFVLGSVMFFLMRKNRKSNEAMLILENVARDKDKMLAQIMKSLSCGVFVFDIDKQEIFMINEETKKIYEISDTDSNIDINYIVNKMDEKERFMVLDDSYRFLTPGYEKVFEHKINQSDGRVLNVIVHMKTVEEFTRKYIVVTTTEITEKVKLEEILKFERLQYKDAIIRSCSIAVALDITKGVVNKENIIKTTDKGITEKLTFPYEFDDFINGWEEVAEPVYFGENWLNRQKMLDAYEAGVTLLETEYCYEESQRYYTLRALLMKNENDNHIYASIFCYDVTDKKRLENKAKLELEKAFESAKRANMAKTDFLSKMSHDIRTPMNTIIGMTDIALLNFDNKQKTKEFLKKISIAGKHLLELINEVLDMRKIEEGVLVLNEVKVDIQKIIENTLMMTREQDSKSHHNIKVDLTGVKHIMICADYLRIQQILINLLNNSIKYTPEDGNISLKIVEKESDRDNSSYYIFVVEDNGIGMSEDFVERIFEPFVREEDSRISKVSGTGLGMSIVKNVVDLMNGEIKVESELHRGTKITVKLLFEYFDDEITQEMEIKEKYFPQEKVDFSNATILLVEDQDFNREIATEFIQMTGARVDIAVDGREALSKFDESANNYYDLIFMDVQMPVMDGYSATKEIRKLDREDASSIPIIALTANAFDNDVIDAIESGMNDHISKPIDFRRICTVLSKWLQK